MTEGSISPGRAGSSQCTIAGVDICWAHVPGQQLHSSLHVAHPHLDSEATLLLPPTFDSSLDELSWVVYQFHKITCMLDPLLGPEGNWRRHPCVLILELQKAVMLLALTFSSSRQQTGNLRQWWPLCLGLFTFVMDTMSPKLVIWVTQR